MLILHHFDISPFAEKVRLALGLKACTWHSVDIPAVMPKPDLTALTGGYRKTPVLQVGADIYCDTQCIARELERRYPEPSLFPAGSEGLCLALSQWSDAAFFQPGAGLSMATNEALPEVILKDRREFFSFLDFSRLQQDLPHFYAQFDAHLELVAAMLADGRDYVLGAEPAWVDVLAYFPIWMARGNISGAPALLEPFAQLQPWEERVTAWGHGTRQTLSAGDALAVAREAEPSAGGRVENSPGNDFRAGDRVTVAPQDYGAVPVAGELVQLDKRSLAVRRTDPRAGEVVVHFPRIGYRLQKET